MGLKGTVVSAPHSEQVVRVSVRTRALPLARLDLHCLQRFGSFLNCLSWKKNCSPAVKTKSAPQSTHFNTRSWKSMAASQQGGCTGPAAEESAAVAVPCLCELQNEGLGPHLMERQRIVCRNKSGKTERYTALTRDANEAENESTHRPLLICPLGCLPSPAVEAAVAAFLREWFPG